MHGILCSVAPTSACDALVSWSRHNGVPACMKLSKILPYVCCCAGLLNVFMTRLEDGPLDKSEETFRAVSGLLSLLQCFQGDMHGDFQRDMASFFCGRFRKLQELRYAPLVLCDLHLAGREHLLAQWWCANAALMAWEVQQVCITLK